jgi:inosine/xanthosine triphosphatase
MIRIAVGTLNPAKVQAVESALMSVVAKILPVDVSSGVSNQPFSDEETIQGAVNRARNALAQTGADLAIGLEGGVVETEYGMFLCNWGALVSLKGEPILAGGARILLPQEIARQLKRGIELGVIMDQYARKKDVRKKEGAIGIFTSGYVNRSDMFTHIVKMLVGQYFYHVNEN